MCIYMYMYVHVCTYHNANMYIYIEAYESVRKMKVNMIIITAKTIRELCRAEYTHTCTLGDFHFYI